MKTRTYLILSLIVILVVAVMVSWAVGTGNPYLAIITLLWAMGTLYVARKRIEEVVEDERNIRINEKAAMRAVEFFVAGGVIAGTVLYSVSTTESDFTQAGLTLGIAVTGLLLLYGSFQTYYARIREHPQ